MARNHRRDASMLDELFEFLIEAPSWAGPLVAIFFYAVLRWLLPWLLGVIGKGDEFGESMGLGFSIIAVKFAPYAAGLVILLWIIALVHKVINRQRLDRQTGIESIRELDWREFESLLSEAFHRQGFIVEHLGKSSPDGGIDQRLSKGSATILVQCKHWKSRRVGVKIIRELLGVVTSESAQSGIMVTSGQFTRDAAEFAERNPIRLIGGQELVKIIGEVQKFKRIRSAIEPSIAPAPRSDTAPNEVVEAPKCPKCGADMVRRVAKQGKHSGSEFYGCARYPECRGIRDLTQ